MEGMLISYDWELIIEDVMCGTSQCAIYIVNKSSYSPGTPKTSIAIPGNSSPEFRLELELEVQVQVGVLDLNSRDSTNRFGIPGNSKI